MEKCKNIQDFKGITECGVGAINDIIPLLIGIGLLVFIFGLIKYVRSGADEKARTEGRNFIIYGIVALFVMVSVWGLVAILTNTFFPGAGIPQLKIG